MGPEMVVVVVVLPVRPELLEVVVVLPLGPELVKGVVLFKGLDLWSNTFLPFLLVLATLVALFLELHHFISVGMLL